MRLLLSALILALAAGIATGEVVLLRQVLDGAGGGSGNANYLQRSSVGQAWNGPLQNAGFLAYAGYLAGLGDEETAAPADLPERFALKGCYPNPFNPVTTLSFALPEASRVQVGLYDLRGRLLIRHPAEAFEAGHHEFVLDAGDLPSGVYLVRLVAGDHRDSRKLILLK